MKKLLLIASLMLIHEIALTQNIAYHRPDEKHFYAGGPGERYINYFPDSVRIEFLDHNVIIVAEATNFNQAVEVVGMLQSELMDLVSQIERSYSKLDGQHSYQVHVHKTLNGFKEIKVEGPETRRSQVLVKNKEIVQLLPPGWELFVQDKKYKLYVYTPDLDQLKKLNANDFSNVQQNLRDSQTFPVRRKSVKSRFIVRNGAIEYKDVRFYHPLDLIGLSLSAGAGVLRNKVYPEVTGTLEFSFADRFNRKNHRIELGYSSQYFASQKPEGGFNQNISSFVTLSYSKNFSTNPNEHSWFGIGGGYLIQKAGDFDFYKGKTMKFFLITTPGNSNFNINPEFYLTDDFKKVSLGLRLQYRL